MELLFPIQLFPLHRGNHKDLVNVQYPRTKRRKIRRKMNHEEKGFSLSPEKNHMGEIKGDSPTSYQLNFLWDTTSQFIRLGFLTHLFTRSSYNDASFMIFSIVLLWIFSWITILLFLSLRLLWWCHPILFGILWYFYNYVL